MERGERAPVAPAKEFAALKRTWLLTVDIRKNTRSRPTCPS